MAGVLPGRFVPEQRTVLQGGARRSVLQWRAVFRSVSFPVMVVWRVDGSARRRSAANRTRKVGFPAIAALRPFLAWIIRKGVRKVS